MGSNNNSAPKSENYEAQSMADLKQYAVYIVAVIILALAGFFGWRYWQGHTVPTDTVAADEYADIQRLNDKVVLAEQNPDLESDAQQTLAADRSALETQVDALVAAHPQSVYAWQALLLKARQQADAEDYKGASASLKQALDIPLKDAGLTAMTQLRYATTLLAAGDVDGALAAASQELPNAFEPSKQELLGDIYLAQKKQPEAERAYENAWGLLINRQEERAILRLKMESIGLTPEAMPEQPPLVTATAPLSLPELSVNDNNTASVQLANNENESDNVKLDDTNTNIAEIAGDINDGSVTTNKPSGQNTSSPDPSKK